MSAFEQRFELRHELQVTGGATVSIFPAVEKMLSEESDYQHALQFVASKKDMSRYRSMVDFLFCEIFIKWQYSCFQFYDDPDRPQLRTLISEEERQRYETWLVAGLKLAKEKFEAKRIESWTSFRIQVLRIAA